MPYADPLGHDEADLGHVSAWAASSLALLVSCSQPDLRPDINDSLLKLPWLHTLQEPHGPNAPPQAPDASLSGCVSRLCNVPDHARGDGV